MVQWFAEHLRVAVGGDSQVHVLRFVAGSH